MTWMSASAWFWAAHHWRTTCLESLNGSRDMMCECPRHGIVRDAVSTAPLPRCQLPSAQVAALQKRPALLVATPGRLLDLLDAGALTLGGVTAVALDEADKMLSLGFEPQLRRLQALLLPPKQAGSGAKHKRPQVRQAGLGFRV